MARAIATDPETSPWWTTNAAMVLRWLDDASSVLLVIDIEGQAAGVIMYEEETDPYYKFAGVDISLLSPWIGRGFGAEALRVLARYLFEERGHHRLQIDPAVDNARAIRAYERVGFKPVGVLRGYERTGENEWRDALLMDMLAGELAE